MAKPEDRDGDGAAESQRLAEASLGRTLLPGLSLLFSNAAASNEAWQAMVRVARFPNPPHTVLPLTLVTFFPYIAQHVIDPFRVTIAGAAPRDVAVPAVRRVARVLRRRRRRRMRFHFRGGWGRFRGCRGRRTRRPWRWSKPDRKRSKTRYPASPFLGCGEAFGDRRVARRDAADFKRYRLARFPNPDTV